MPRSRIGNLFREGVDRVFLHNRGFDANAAGSGWNRQGVWQGIGQTAAGAALPGGGLLAGRLIDMYNRNHAQNPSNTPLTPQSNFSFNRGTLGSLTGPLPFNPGQPQAPQNNGNPFGTPQGFDPNQYALSNPYGGMQNHQQPAPMGGMAGLTGQAASMGGARGAHSQGGITDPAAIQAFMESMRRQQQYMDTGPERLA